MYSSKCSKCLLGGERFALGAGYSNSDIHNFRALQHGLSARYNAPSLSWRVRTLVESAYGDPVDWQQPKAR